MLNASRRSANLPTSRNQTLETEVQMLQRVMPELMGPKNIQVLNDEAHHCYREKPDDDDDEELTGDDRKEAGNRKIDFGESIVELSRGPVWK